MKYRKFNKYEKKEHRTNQINKAMSGAGLYLFENNNDATLTLPRPTKSGCRTVEGRKQFQGDSYYIQMVRTGELKLIKTLQTPQQQEAQEQQLQEQQQTLQENKMPEKEEKLILDQPDMITEQGTVEHVAAQPVTEKPLNEEGGEDQSEAPDVLINEDPEGFLIIDD